MSTGSPITSDAAASNATRGRVDSWFGAVLVVIAAGLAVVIFPEFAPALAWPFLFVVPGALLIKRVIPDVRAPAAVGAGIVVSVELSTHLVYLLSLALGYSSASVLLATELLALASWCVATRGGASLLDGLSSAAVAQAWSRYRAQWLVAALCGGITAAVLGLSLFHHTADGWVSGASNWSDFLLHVSIATTVAHGGNFLPQAPFFAGKPLVYHWFPDLHAAITSTISGIGITDCMAAGTTAMTTALALVMSELAIALFGSISAAVIAPLVTIFGGGFGWVMLPLDLIHHRGSLLTLIHTKGYDFDYVSTAFPVFHIPPLYQVGILTQRATAYGIPIIVAAALILWLSLERSSWRGVLCAGVVGAMAAPFNFFAFPVIYLVAFFIFVEHRRIGLRRFVNNGVVFAAPLLYAAIFVGGIYLHRAQQNHVKFVWGWQDAPAGADFGALVFFYATNLGLPLVLAVVALLGNKLPGRWFLGGWVVVLFVIPNIVQVSVVAFDSSKFFQLMWPAVALLAAWLMCRWRIWLVAGAVLVSSLSGIAGGVWAMADTRAVLSDAQYSAAQWIGANTAPKSIFVTPSFINMPTDLAGRLRITGFFTYAADEGYDQTQRDTDVTAIYCDGDQTAANIMHRYHATYVLSSGGVQDCGGHAPTTFDQSGQFETVYSAGGVTIWHLVG